MQTFFITGVEGLYQKLHLVIYAFDVVRFASAGQLAFDLKFLTMKYGFFRLEKPNSQQCQIMIIMPPWEQQLLEIFPAVFWGDL